MGRHRIEMAGMRFGKLTVIGPTRDKPTHGHRLRWHCVPDHPAAPLPVPDPPMLTVLRSLAAAGAARRIGCVVGRFNGAGTGAHY